MLGSQCDKSRKETRKERPQIEKGFGKMCEAEQITKSNGESKPAEGDSERGNNKGVKAQEKHRIFERVGEQRGG